MKVNMSLREIHREEQWDAFVHYSKEQNKTLMQAGYPINEPFILLGKLEGGEFHYDEYYCGGAFWSGTRQTALPYIREHFDELEPGQVICTEFIRGERTTPKISEHFETQEGAF